jgi:hypothetical protein
VVVDVRPHLDLFDLNDFLFLLGFSFLFLLLIFVFAVIEDLAYGRGRIRRDLNKIEACLRCDSYRLIGGNDAAFFTLVINKKNLRNINVFIDARPIGLLGRGCKWSTCYGLLSMSC